MEVFGKISVCLACALVLVMGCGKSESNNESIMREASAKCLLPSVLSDVSHSKLTSLNELEKTLKGKYEIDTVHLYQSTTSLDNSVREAYYGKAVINTVSSSGTKKIHEPRLSFECTDFNRKALTPLRTGMTIPVADFIHFPSGRITMFDENSGFYDDPKFNFPSIADIHFDSSSLASYKNMEKERIGEPPYLLNRYLGELSAAWPSSHKFYLNTSNEVEIRFSSTDAVDDGNGRTFKTTSSALITYKKFPR